MNTRLQKCTVFGQATATLQPIRSSLGISLFISPSTWVQARSKQGPSKVQAGENTQTSRLSNLALAAALYTQTSDGKCHARIFHGEKLHTLIYCINGALILQSMKRHRQSFGVRVDDGHLGFLLISLVGSVAAERMSPCPPCNQGATNHLLRARSPTASPLGSSWNPTSHLIHKCIAILPISVDISTTRDVLQVALRVPEDSLEQLNAPANAT
jgi:hypothetical protein